jgi:predicted RNA binding protein YcfA (HicA-like mRNA interferase family)
MGIELPDGVTSRPVSRPAVGSDRVTKDLKQILRTAEWQGWRVELQRGGHYKLYPPNGDRIVTTGSTPSAPSALRNLIAEMRRRGFEWKGR